MSTQHGLLVACMEADLHLRHACREAGHSSNGAVITEERLSDSGYKDVNHAIHPKAPSNPHRNDEQGTQASAEGPC
ncbi:MAG: hypothetical protein ACRERU_08995 [Methylococcales bacterium]